MWNFKDFLFWKKDPEPEPEVIDRTDPFYEGEDADNDQCRLDNARLEVKDLCITYGTPEMSCMMDEIWRQVGLKIFNKNYGEY